MSLASILAQFTSFIPGLRLIDGGELLAMANNIFSTSSGIVARAGGGQASATVLKTVLNEIDTVANANDSVMLPLAVPGLQVQVNNVTATSLQVFGQLANPNVAGGGGDTIAASNSSTQQATATGVAHAANTAFTYTCFVAGQWKQN